MNRPTKSIDVEPVTVIDTIQEIVSKMEVPQVGYINFDAGRNLQIVNGLIKMDSSRSLRDKKYPLIALQLPNYEDLGSPYISVTIRRIVIATLTDPNIPVLDRYKEDGTFKLVLYPVYYEFLNQIARSSFTNGSDPEAVVHKKIDNPCGWETAAKELTDFVDAIEIIDLKLNLIKPKICK